MKDFFNLENAISNMLRASDDLNELFEMKYQGGVLPEDVTNAILGIMEMHKVRQQKLLNEFNKFFELEEFCTDPEKLGLRTKMFGRLDEGFEEIDETPVIKPAKKKKK